MPMNPRLLMPRATGFDPRSVSGLEAWWDAADTSKVTTVSGFVSEWIDKSGNGRNALQGNANSRPSYSDTQNGRKVLTFDGSNDRLATASGISLGTGGYTVFIAGQHAGGFTVMLEGASLNPYLSSLSGVPFTGFRHYDGAAAVDTPGGVFTASVFFVVEYVISPSARIIAVDGTQQVSGAGTSRAATLQNIGSTSTAFYFNGRIGEILVYGSALNASARAKARSYLGKKWGVATA